MLNFRSRHTFVLLGFFAIHLLLIAPNAQATVLQPTAMLPPVNGTYGVNAMSCLLAGCIEEADLGNLMPTSIMFVGGNELVTATGTLDAEVFQNVGGMPGAPIGTFILSGTLSFTYLGRTSDTQLGTFTSLVTSFNFMGTFNSHTIVTQLVTNQGGNTGVTTVAKAPGVDLFAVDSFFDVFAAISVDGGPFMPGPERRLTLENAPEGGSGGLALLGMCGFAVVAWRRRVRSAVATGVHTAR